jgi:hypothetical protein
MVHYTGNREPRVVTTVTPINALTALLWNDMLDQLTHQQFKRSPTY